MKSLKVCFLTFTKALVLAGVIVAAFIVPTIAQDEPAQSDWEQDYPWSDEPMETFDPERFEREHSEHFVADEAPKAFGIEGSLSLPETTEPKSTVELGSFKIDPTETYGNIEDFLMEHHGMAREEAKRVSGEIFELFVKMRTEGRRLERQMHDEDFEAELESGKLKIPHTIKDELERDRIRTMGRAKVTKGAGGVKWIRVVHHRIHTAFTFYNVDKVDPRSKHVDLIRANNHFNSGKHIRPEEYSDSRQSRLRRKGALLGRDELTTFYHERSANPDAPPVVERVEFFPRPEKGSDQYRYEFKLACDKPFSWSNMLVNGAVMGLFQVGFLVGIGYVTPHIPLLGGHQEPPSNLILGFTWIYSLYAGGWMYPKLRAYSQRLTQNTRFFLRGFSISLLYALIYKAITTYEDFGAAWDAGWNPFYSLLAFQLVNLGINFVVNNRVSHELNEMTQLDQETRPKHKYVRPLERVGLKVKVIDFLGQVRYLTISFSARTVDLNDKFKGVKVNLPFLDHDYFLSSGKVLYLFLPALLRYINYRRAVGKDSALVGDYRKRWEATLTARTLKLMAATAKKANPKQACRWLISKMNEPAPRLPRQYHDDFSHWLF